MKKHITTAVCMAFIAAALTSCSTAKTDTQPENKPSGVQSSGESSSGEEGGEDVVLNFVIHGDMDTLTKLIDDYNAADNGYRVEVKQYYTPRQDEHGESLTYTDEENRYTDMEILHDIIYTSDVDIVCDTSFHHISNYDILKGKGAFVDLYQFLENDPEINVETLDNHILKLNEIDGKLYSIPYLYSLTTLSGESKYVGTKENWTFDEFVEHWEAMPEGSTICGAFNNNSVFNVIMRGNITSFIDYKNSEVHFDSPDFKRMLEFCNRFEPKQGEKNEYDYDAPSMLREHPVTGIMSAVSFNRDNGLTCVGYPSEDGCGAYLSTQFRSFSICANSSPEKQQASWDFLRNIWTVENQVEQAIPRLSGGGIESDHYSSELGLCVNKEAFDIIAERLINKEFYPKRQSNKFEEFDTKFPTEKDVAEMRRYIESINRWGEPADRAVWLIINDELLAYFAGEITVDQCVDRIQNRASIWISEQS